jgi:hypothetical protein
LPRAGKAFASTQAAWRFFQNESVTLPALVEPLRDVGRRGAAASPSEYVLVVHDWSKLSYDHGSKTDLVKLPGRANNFGYDLSVALLVDAHDGAPLAPMDLELWSQEGVHSTRSPQRRQPVAHIEQVFQTMRAAVHWQLPRVPVHVVDSEADGLAQFREWSGDGHLFVIRADAIRHAEWDGAKASFPEISGQLRDQGAFVEVGAVEYHGRAAQQFVAEAAVTFTAVGRKRQGKKRNRIPGDSLTLRLVMSQVRDVEGRLLAMWYLLSNLPASVGGQVIAQWYYWRWRIESFFKLMKSHGQEMEAWLQRDGLRIAKRALVAAMSCTAAWQLRHDPSPAARELERVLVRLSGRLTKRKRPVTTPAVLAGLQNLLSLLLILEDYTPDQLRRLLRQTLPMLIDTG